MKLKITLYGSQNLNTLAESVDSIASAFGRGCHQLILQNDGTFPTEVVVQTTPLIIPRTYIADVVVECEGKIQADDTVVLLTIAEKLGELWAEFINSFVDNASLKAIRVATSVCVVKWSPHQ